MSEPAARVVRAAEAWLATRTEALRLLDALEDDYSASVWGEAEAIAQEAADRLADAVRALQRDRRVLGLGLC